jgi:bacillithiol biosynthesis deacetylase BshB1
MNNEIDILVFAAHPDDAELGCSGTIMAHLNIGYKVAIIDLTQGELGTRGTIDTRKIEAAKASKIMGITIRENLQLADCFFRKDRESLLKIIACIRKYRPKIILCNAMEDRHVDHGRAADLIEEAAFLAGLQKIETTENGVSQKAWRPINIYHYIQDRMTKPDLVFDITPFYAKKIKSILAFESQFYNPYSEEPETPISSQHFLKYIEGRAIEFGRMIGVHYGEGFTVKRNIGSKNLMDLI